MDHLPAPSPGELASDAAPRSRLSSRTRQVAVDALVAAVLAALLVGGVWLNAQLPELADHQPSVWTYASGVTLCAGLVFRRLRPLTGLVVCALAFGWFRIANGVDGGASSVALFLSLVAAGTYGRGRARAYTRAVAVLALMGLVAWSMFLQPQLSTDFPAIAALQAYSLAFNVFFFAAGWVLGDQLRLRRLREHELANRTAELVRRTLELEEERQRTAEQATTAERLRLARELHDVLGHHVSVMGVQAAAARRILDRDPERAAEALGAIESSSRGAVTELQRVLAILRADDRERGGGLGVRERLDGLRAELRTAGLSVTSQVRDLPPLPTEIDLALSRVVQESLTNALRHAGPGTSAWVRLRGVDGAVEIEVVDDAGGDPLPPEERRGAGSGLTGMRERVELHGGRFVAGPVRPRGFRVHAWLPLPSTSGPVAGPPPVAGEDAATVGGPR